MIDLRAMLGAIGTDTLFAVAHNNPDPDALAGCFGLKWLVERLTPARVEIVHGGIVSRRNNLKMVEVLGIPLTTAPPLPCTPGGRYALVDCQPGQRNHPLPPEVVPFLVVDHHPTPPGPPYDVPFRDVRSDVGSTSAMVCDYLWTLGLQPSSGLATALYYGISTDTDGLSRDATALDREMYHRLFPLVDPEKLEQIVRPDLPRAYYHDMGDAVFSARLYDTALVSDLGLVWSPEMPAEMSDFLLRMEGVESTFVFGLFEGQIYFSLRAARPGDHMGNLALRMVEGIGAAGGHSRAAGGQVPYTPDSLGMLRARFFRAICRHDHEGVPVAAAPDLPLGSTRTPTPTD